MIVVTTEAIPGRSICQVIGEVMGVTARAANAYTEGVKVLHGGQAQPGMPSLVRWRRDAIRQMIDEATHLGADAVIGMKFDTRQITSSWSEICAYGTAVRLSDPISSPPAPYVGRIPHRPGT
jgi:uncharacterized protein YbjQ (UPF0145 family)